MELNTNVLFNEKAMYISYISPFMKTKKGNALQRTKGVKKIRNENNEIDFEHINKIVSDMKSILESFKVYASDYAGYVNAKNQFDELAVAFIYEGSDFENIYNQNTIVKAMETKIPLYKDDGVSFVDPAIAMMGESGSGKTTLTKQLIGSIGSDFPATSQANTTVGNFYVHYDKNAKQYKCCVSLFSKAQLIERIRNSVIGITQKTLSDANCDEDVCDIIYDIITVSPDRKCRLAYLVSKDDVKKVNVDGIIAYFMYLWREYANSVEDLDDKTEYKLIDDSKILIGFEEYLELVLCQEDMGNQNRLFEFFSSIVEVIVDRVDMVVRELVNEIFKPTNNLFEMIMTKSVTVLDEGEVYELGTDDGEWEKWNVVGKKIFPKMVAVSLDSDQVDYVPSFYNMMELISSAKKGTYSLYPLIEEMRIYGKFRPNWLEVNEEIETNYILVDTEGIGHDMKSNDISMALRSLLDKCEMIIYSQNGSQQLSDKFANALGMLIHSAEIEKTRFVFNRMERFDGKDDVDTKIRFIKEGLQNAMSKITADEKEQEQQVVRGRESSYMNMILGKSLFMEYMECKVFDSECLVLPKDVAVHDMLMDKKENAENDEEAKMLAIAAGAFEIQFDEKTNPVKNLRKIMRQLEESSKSVAMNYMPVICPMYRADRLTNELNMVINEFLNEFTSRVNGNPWQTVKAFNSRMAFNWDYREWRDLRPESELIGKLQTHLMSYMLNPENMDSIDKEVLIQYVNMLFNKKLNSEFFNVAEELIYQGLVEECWKPLAEKGGPGSTETRRKEINRQISDKFMKSKNGNVLYLQIRNNLFDKKIIDGFKCEYI